VDTYQFRPEEIQVKTMDDTLLIEGRHEDVRDRDNYTKMVGGLKLSWHLTKIGLYLLLHHIIYSIF
jgi:hypothetical protein